jgi:hypothetical protein
MKQIYHAFKELRGDQIAGDTYRVRKLCGEFRKHVRGRLEACYVNESYVWGYEVGSWKCLTTIGDDSQRP